MLIIACSGSGRRTVYSSGIAPVNEARNGVIRVNLLYTDAESKTEYLLKSGSGFLVNEETMITCAHVLNLSPAEVKKAKKEIGKKFKKDYHDHLSVRVIVMGDVYIAAEVKNQSETIDFAILTLAETISDRTPLSIAKKKALDATQSVYALGFPGAVDYFQNINSYTYDDVTVTDGKVAKTTTIDNVEMIQHSAVISAGNSGGPLVDESGAVVGMNNASIDNTYYYAISIEQITEVLDALNVAYLEDGKVKGAVDTSGLDAELAAAAKIATDNYQEESVKTLSEAVTSAQSLTANEQATQVQVDEAAAAVKNAAAALIKKQAPFDMTILLYAMIGVVLILVVFLINKMIRSKGRRVTASAATQTISSRPLTTSPPSRESSFRPTDDLTIRPSSPSNQFDDGEDLTVKLGVGAACLVRSDTREQIEIRSAEFILGRGENKANYCITNHNTVSRVHAKIIAGGGKYSIVDLDSTSGTFLNEQRLSANQAQELRNGDAIRLSDVAFEFQIVK
jgi:pSer/pThr/pTyr-binding forkhead associated (FHA) protein/V8-like Glu-specific endopeptidase